jgi:two-component system, cell cycle sensor histidine kinase and response regulator CckA
MREESVRWLADSLGLPFMEERQDGTLYRNDAAQNALKSDQGYGFVQAVAELIENVGDSAKLEEQIARARTGIPVDYRTDTGRRVLLLPAEKYHVCAVFVPFDLSERSSSNTEKQKLTDGLFHELANALGAIAGWAQLARGGTRVEEALELIEKASKSVWSISRQILGHNQEQIRDSVTSVTDMSASVDEAVRLIALKASQVGVVIHHRITPGLEVKCAPDDVWSMIWNLMTNAVEAMTYGGTLTVELTGQETTVRFVVMDDGPGMDDTIKERVFQPYFTTKEKGTGLGLALVKQAVEAAGGAIELISSRGKGTRFNIELPRSIGVNRKQEQSHRSNARASSLYFAEPISGRILLVEDDTGLREMMATALAMRGAKVVAACNAGEAMGTEGRFDVALMDMQLPDRNGDRLLADLRAIGKVNLGIIVTGHNRPSRYAQGGKPDGYLRKPFQIEELFERVATVLRHEKPEEVAVS